MRLERIGEDSALIARIEAINVAAFPEIERISIKNFLKMSRKGQLEIAAIFEDFSALVAGDATGKNRAAAGKSFEASNLTSENFKVQANVRSEALNLKRDRDGGCDDAAYENFKVVDSKNGNFKTNDLAGKNCGTQDAANANLCAEGQNLGATDRKRGALDRDLDAANLGASIQDLETADQKFGVAEASSQNTDQSCGARASALSNAINSIHDEAAQRDFCGKAGQGFVSCAAQNLSGAAARRDSKNGATQDFSSEELVGFFVYRTEQTYKRVVSHHKQPPPRLNADKILKSKAHSGAEFDGAEDEISGGEISSIAAEGRISSGTTESEIPSGGESEIFYVAYLGIDVKFRGLGIGSRLLALIAKQNPSAQIVLDVEPPHEDAPNLAQRLRRIEFYGRHGFGRCGKFFNYAGLSFEILAKPSLSAPQQGFDVASFVKFIGAGNKFRFKITDAPLYKN